MKDTANFDSLHNIIPGKHFYQFYKGAEDYLHVMISYFQAGLEKGEGCLWLVSKKTGLDSAIAQAKNAILNAEKYLATGQFKILSAEEWYLTSGRFDEEKAITNAAHYVDQIKKLEVKILRGSGDVGAIPRMDWVKVHAYEKKMALWIKTQPIIGLCAYPILECTPTETKAVLDCHDDVLIGRF